LSKKIGKEKEIGAGRNSRWCGRKGKGNSASRDERRNKMENLELFVRARACP